MKILLTNLTKDNIENVATHMEGVSYADIHRVSILEEPMYVQQKLRRIANNPAANGQRNTYVQLATYGDITKLLRIWHNSDRTIDVDILTKTDGDWVGENIIENGLPTLIQCLSEYDTIRRFLPEEWQNTLTNELLDLRQHCAELEDQVNSLKLHLEEQDEHKLFCKMAAWVEILRRRSDITDAEFEAAWGDGKLPHDLF